MTVKKLILLVLAAGALMAVACGKPVRVAVLTGPHGYEKESFVPFMNGLEGVTWKEYKNPEAQDLFKPENAGEYDVLMFYDMCPKISGERKADLVKLVRDGKPVFVLHHGLGTYNDWPEFYKIAGCIYIWSKPKRIDGKEYGYSSYREGVTIDITVADKEHFITKGNDERFSITDEVYGKMWQSPDIRPLWVTNHGESSRVLLYTHQYGKGRVAGMVPGHGKGSFGEKNYKNAFNRALLWLAQEN